MSFEKNDLTNCFDNCRKEVTGETLNQVRANYFIGALMSESDDTAIGGLNINGSGRINNINAEKKNSKRSIEDMILMNMITEMSLPDFENMMVGKYGEDFAENMAAEYLDPDVYNEIMKIQDPEERRKAIADAINEGIANGTIDPADIYANPDFKEWLDKRRADSQAQNVDELAQNNENRNLNDDADNNAGLTEDSELQNDIISAFGRPIDFS